MYSIYAPISVTYLGESGALSSDDDVHQVDIATPAERYKWGLTKGPALSRNNVEVRASVRGRSAYAKRDFRPGDFVCEYRGVLKPKSESLQDEQEYRELGTVLMYSTKEVHLQLMQLIPSMTLGAISTMLARMLTCRKCAQWSQVWGNDASPEWGSRQLAISRKVKNYSLIME